MPKRGNNGTNVDFVVSGSGPNPTNVSFGFKITKSF